MTLIVGLFILAAGYAVFRKVKVRLGTLAAVPLMASNMTDANSFDIAKRVLLPVLAGLVVVTIMAMIMS